MSNQTDHPMRRDPSSMLGSQNRSCEAVNAAVMPPACGAKTRSGAPCRALAMRNGRCRMHGGASTGAKTAAGLKRVQTVALVHGGRSRETIEFRRMIRDMRAAARQLVELA